MNMFEIAIFNREVRDLIAEGEHHKQLKDSWADLNYIEIRADNATEAKRKIFKRYPEEKGFEISQVIESIY